MNGSKSVAAFVLGALVAAGLAAGGYLVGQGVAKVRSADPAPGASRCVDRTSDARLECRSCLNGAAVRRRWRITWDSWITSRSR